MAASATNISLTFLEKFERGIYSIKRVPRILLIDHKGVHVNKNGPYPDEIKSLEKMDWQGDKLLMPKLKGSSGGDFSFSIGIINAKHFDGRDKLDTLYSNEYERDDTIMIVDRISLQEALKHLTVEISCNMDYYMSNMNEMEKDLERPVKHLDLTDEDLLKELEKELLYKQAIKIFGQENDDDDNVTAEESADHKAFRKAIALREFHLLYWDGNYRIATARRGSYYLLFFYITS